MPAILNRARTSLAWALDLLTTSGRLPARAARLLWAALNRYIDAGTAPEALRGCSAPQRPITPSELRQRPVREQASVQREDAGEDHVPNRFLPL